jgi:hypothetical protein
MSGKSPRCSRIVMCLLSRAIHGIPRPYLRNRRAGLIFPIAAGTFFGVNGFCRGRPGAAAGVLPPAAQVGLLLLARLVEDRHDG